MKKLTSNEIRRKWFDFFKSKGHKVMDSASLIPMDDNSLLFINAGVTPLKKYFDGSVVPESKRLVSIQKCIRTNDIDNVGVTKRHQTFFEMMGNFSVGDYFKEEALEFAFEFLTSEKWMDIDKDKIYVTIYTEDEIAYNKWVSLGLDPTHIVKLESNFWEIGEGPCGPDSEIFFDRGSDYDLDGTAFEKFKKDEDQERFVEIWNNVFSQFNSKKGIPRNEYKELPHKNIDTGAGLERWCCIFQGVDSNFDTDLFVPIIEKIEDLTGKKYNNDMPFKVIADHLRAITVALSDGCIFENTGRGYVLRRLLRRSVRMGKKLGMNEPFLYKLVDTITNNMKEFYPELEEQKSIVKTLILQEEELFYKTLAAGERRLNELMKESTDKTISGYEVFKLYDTFGFPYELTLEYLTDEGYTTDREEFNKYMHEAKNLAKNSRKIEQSMTSQNEELLNFTEKSEFLYDTYELESKVIGLFKDGHQVDYLDSDGYVILDKTCFYSTSGGQLSDKGAMKNGNFKAKVIDCIKAPNGQTLHKVEIVDGTIVINDTCCIKIMEDRRNKTAKNHSTVHIIQKVLQDKLSKNIHQAGSYVDSEKLRFDFTYTGKITDDEILSIEKEVNERIDRFDEVLIKEMKLEDAKKIGAMALFNEKYKDIVRVVKIGDSIELCGGTHVSNTADIGRFAISKVESKGSNLYRLEGTTADEIENLIGDIVKHYVDEIKVLLDKAKDLLNKAKKEGIELDFNIELDQQGISSYKDIIYNKNQLSYVQNEVRLLEKKYNEAKLKNASSNLDEYINFCKQYNDVKYIIMKTDNKEINVLKEIVDNLMNKINKGLIFIANVKDDNVNFICRSNCSINAGFTVKKASQMSDGNGGGSPTFAQGGGKTTLKLDEIFSTIEQDIKNM
ncbi:MAG: alanine--tRNA ligase [bacterium]|nr:alanine--tRNA ligase [bacterium]